MRLDRRLVRLKHKRFGASKVLGLQRGDEPGSSPVRFLYYSISIS